MRSSHSLVILVVVTLAGCGPKPEAAKPPTADTAAMMGGTHMVLQGMRMLPLMHAHLDSLRDIAPVQLAAMMPAHQELASRMMDAMGTDMRVMNMQPDSAWAALSDSLRQDLAELPALSGTALERRLDGHIVRMRRMMTMHQAMMRM